MQGGNPVINNLRGTQTPQGNIVPQLNGIASLGNIPNNMPPQQNGVMISNPIPVQQIPKVQSPVQQIPQVQNSVQQIPQVQSPMPISVQNIQQSLNLSNPKTVTVNGQTINLDGLNMQNSGNTSGMSMSPQQAEALKQFSSQNKELK